MTGPDVRLRPVPTGSDAAQWLYERGGEFHGLEVRRHAPAVLRSRLEVLGVRLLRAEVDGAVVAVAGYAVNPANHRQATVSVSAVGDEHTRPVLQGLLDLLRTTARTTSFLVQGTDEATAAHRDLGFTEVGRLRARRYRDHRFHDDVVLALVSPEGGGRS